MLFNKKTQVIHNQVVKI